MSQQLQITGGAKVRSLEGVITGTSGVLSSVPLGAANGVATLDSGGKVPVSQLPASVVTYLGTWNAATNTPTLVNGTGDAGDLYICNVAGTVNFGAGPITFAVGDWVLYGSGTWQKSNGQNGTVTSVAASITGNSLGITGSPITTAGTLAFAFAGTNLQYVNGAGNLTTFPTLLSSVGLSMPSAFSVSNSPLTSNGTIAVTGAGYPSQYIRGDGTLADFPTSGGGGSSVSYYLNGGTSQGTIGGVNYYQMSKTAVTSSGVDFAKSGDGLIVSFLTDAGDPAQLNIPAGNWNYEIYASMSSNGGTPQIYAELYVYNGTTFTLISTSSNEILYDGVNLNLYTFAMTVPATTLTITDRLAIKLYSTNSGGKTTTVHTQDSHLCQIITTFSTGITALNGLTAQVQYFATGTSGSDFNISSSTATHTFNLPTASATNRGALSSADWTTFNSKVGGSGSDGRVAFWNGASSLSSNANLYWDNSTSRLGIGTNTPNASLGILNSSSTGLQIRTSDTSNQYQANIYWDASYGMVYGYYRTGASTTAHNLTFYNALGGFLSVPESSNNNIGFNTLNPQGSSATTVYDFTSISTSVELRLHNPTTGYTSTDGSYIKVTPTALVIANVETASQILINNGGSGVVTIDGTNNVAIGNIGVIPMTQQLTVVGSIQAYGGSIYQTVTSSMLKANSSGQIIAAVGGTDYEYPLTFSSPLVRTTNTISIPAATTSVNGYLTSTDWNTFNNKGSGTVTSVTGTAPVVSSGGTTPAISMAAATTSVSGYLTSTDWNTFNGKFTLPSLTSGSILFSNGSTIAQNNNRLYWDNTNMRLGIGTQSVSQYVTYIAANVGENANAWLGIENKNTTGSTAVRLLLNGSTTSGFQYVQSTNLTQIYANAGDILLSNGSSLGLKIANTTGAATFDSSATATSFVKTGGTSSQFLKADGSVDSTAYGTITSVTATAPVVSSGGTTPVISMAAASASVAGYVTTGTQTIAGAKTFSSAAIFSSTINSVGSIVASGTGNVTLAAYSSDNFPLFQLVDSRVGGKNWNIENGRTSAGLLELYSSTVGTVVTITQAGAGTFSSTLQATKIGIGGAPSAFILDVTGTAKVSGVLTLGGGTGGLNFTSSTSITNTGASGYISIYANGGGLFLGGSAATTNVTIASGGLTTFTNGIGVNGYNASINAAALFSGSVGINNITPSYSLDVTGTGRFSDTLYSTKTSGRSFGNDSYGTNFGWIAMYGTTQGIQLGFEGTTGGQLITGAGANYGILVSKAGLAISANNGVTNHLNIASTGAATFSGPTVTIGSAVAATNVKLLLNGVASKAAGIEFQQNGTAQWYIGNGIASEDNNFELYNSNGTMAMKIIKSTNAINFIGNVGIGTALPTRLLDVSNTSGDSSIAITSADTTGQSSLFFAKTSDTNIGGVLYTHSDNVMAFRVNDATRMSITSGGNVLIGTTTQTYSTKLEVVSGGDAISSKCDSGGTAILCNPATTGSTSAYFKVGSTNAGYIGHPTSSTTSYNTSPSDERLKYNIEIWNENVLELFKNINPKTYSHISDNDESIRYKGFIAQQMIDKFPEAYPIDRQGFYNYNPSAMVVYLMKAIQEQQAQIEELKQQVQLLLNK